MSAVVALCFLLMLRHLFYKMDSERDLCSRRSGKQVMRFSVPSPSHGSPGLHCLTSALQRGRDLRRIGGMFPNEPLSYSFLGSRWRSSYGVGRRYIYYTSPNTTQGFSCDKHLRMLTTPVEYHPRQIRNKSAIFITLAACSAETAHSA